MNIVEMLAVNPAHDDEMRKPCPSIQRKLLDVFRAVQNVQHRVAKVKYVIISQSVGATNGYRANLM